MLDPRGCSRFKPIRVARAEAREQHDPIHRGGSASQQQNHDPRSQRLEAGDGTRFHGRVGRAGEKDEPDDTVDREPVLVARLAFVGGRAERVTST